MVAREIKLGAQFAFRFDERCGCSRCPCSPGFEILAEDTELARAIVEEPDRYARLVFWAEMLPGGEWKIEGRYRNETFFKGLVLPLAAVALPVPSPTATTSELKN